MSTMRVLVALAAAVTVGGCGSSGGKATDGGTASGGGGGGPGAGSPGGGATASGLPCSDLFDPSMVRTYAIDIDPAELEKVRAEFNNVATLESQGNDFVTRHPVVFHLGSETV